MDGRVGAIRAALDAEGSRGHGDPLVLRPSTPRRSTARSARRPARRPGFGDRRGYQMDPANAREAVREVALDIAEGADMVMVKPAATYLDVIAAVRAATGLPLAAYHVSGEYAMIKAAAERGWLDERTAAMETLTGDRPRRCRPGDHLLRRRRRPLALQESSDDHAADRRGSTTSPTRPTASC